MTSDRLLVGGAVGVHLVFAVAHAISHLTIPVLVADWQYAFVVVTIFVIPLVGLALVATGRVATGAWVVLGSGLASFAFEGLLHFVVPNPDNVAGIEPGVAAFATTATLTTAGDALMVLAAGWVLWRQASAPTDETEATSVP